jgi:DNA helicase-2/ATP-dependent DNA helicase PcrA
MNDIIWSPQQAAFLDWCEHGRGSCVLEAVAGAGKTTTLIEAVRRIEGQVALMAFNNKIAKEIKAKLQQAGINWKKGQAGTCHSFGFSAFKKTFGEPQVNGDKITMMLEEKFDREHEMFPHIGTTARLVSLAKQAALGVLFSDKNLDYWYRIMDHHDLIDEDNQEMGDAILAAAMEVFFASQRVLDVIDFDDMIYLPLFHRCRFWQFDVVMVDEAQDTNPARRALAAAMLKKGGRLIAVGDRHQAIYGFTGADNDSLELIKRDFNAIDLPLNVTYRCPKSVVAFAQQWVSHITAHESAPEGSVTSIRVDELWGRNDLSAGSAILCRNVKPLVSMALALIRRKIACKVEGRDVGASLKKLVNRWKLVQLDALENRLDGYLERETVKLTAKKATAKLQVVEDTVETIKVIINQCRSENKHSVQDVRNYIDDLFADNVSDILVLSTIHKSKGREWETVFWLDRKNTCPSPWARQAWEQDQETNLQYVAATRAKSQLVDLLAA